MSTIVNMVVLSCSIMVILSSYLMFQACFMTSKMLKLWAKTIVASELSLRAKSACYSNHLLWVVHNHTSITPVWLPLLHFNQKLPGLSLKSTLRNSSHLSVSSGVVYRRRTRTPGRCWTYKLSILFVFHEKWFWFQNRVVSELPCETK